MIVQILCTRCPNCQALEANARSAIRSLGVSAEVMKVIELDEIMGMGVMVTPALAIGGVAKSTGRILTVAHITDLLRGGK